MSIVRRIARPLMAAIFISGGLDALRHPATKTGRAAPLIHKIAEPLGLPDDPEMLVRANGATMIGGGALLALGRLPRIASLSLLVSLVPTTYAGHAFWAEEDDAQRAAQRTHFLKNLAIIGGLLIAAADTQGRPGLAWRAQHAADHAGKSASGVRKAAKAQAKAARKSAKRATDSLGS